MSHPVISHAAGHYSEGVFDKRMMTKDQLERLKAVVIATLKPFKGMPSIPGYAEMMKKHLETATIGFFLHSRENLEKHLGHGIKAVLDFQGQAFVIANDKSLEDNYFPAMGRYYGYPECCIQAFIDDVNNRERLVTRTKRHKEGVHHIVCDHCHDSKSPQELLNDMMGRRLCSLHPNTERNDLDQVVIEAELLMLLHEGKLYEPVQG